MVEVDNESRTVTFKEEQDDDWVPNYQRSASFPPANKSNSSDISKVKGDTEEIMINYYTKRDYPSTRDYDLFEDIRIFKAELAALTWYSKTKAEQKNKNVKSRKDKRS